MTKATLPVCMIVEEEALIGMMLEDDLTQAGYEVVGSFSRSMKRSKAAAKPAGSAGSSPSCWRRLWRGS